MIVESSLSISEQIISALLFHPEDSVRILQMIENVQLESIILTRIRSAIESEVSAGSYTGMDSLEISLQYIADRVGPDVLQATLENLSDLSEEYKPDRLEKQIGRIIQFDEVHKCLEEAHNAVSERFDPEGAIKLFQSAVSKSSHTFMDKASDIRFTDSKVRELIEVIKLGENRDLVPIGLDLVEKFGGDVARKEVLTILGGTNTGKSFFLVNGGVKALEAGLRVTHVTLEMSGNLVFERYLKSISRVSEKSPEFAYIDGSSIKSSRLDSKKIEDLDEPDISKLSGIVSDRLTIIDRPEYSFSAEDLEFELEAAESEDRLPDLLIIDSPNLMKLSRGTDLRLGLSEVTRKIRAICKRFSMAGITATQANRDAEKGGRLTLANVSESYDSASVYDTILGYSQTEIQSLNNLATIAVLKSRSGKKNLSFVISQCYDMGLFCVQSCLCNGYLEDIMKSFTQVLRGEDVPDDGDEPIRSIPDRAIGKRIEERKIDSPHKTFKAF